MFKSKNLYQTRPFAKTNYPLFHSFFFNCHTQLPLLKNPRDPLTLWVNRRRSHLRIEGRFHPGACTDPQVTLVELCGHPAPLIHGGRGIHSNEFPYYFVILSLFFYMLFKIFYLFISIFSQSFFLFIYIFFLRTPLYNIRSSVQ